MQTHEDFSRSNPDEGGSTDRGFGYVFTTVFTVVALLPLRSGGDVRIWALAAAAVFFALALFRPGALHHLNKAWMRFAVILSKIIHPIVIGVLYIVVITPFGWVARKAGHDPLRLRFEPSAPSYWIDREPSGPAPESMSRQF
jgi:hypothetical protein